MSCHFLFDLSPVSTTTCLCWSQWTEWVWILLFSTSFDNLSSNRRCVLFIYTSAITREHLQPDVSSVQCLRCLRFTLPTLQTHSQVSKPWIHLWFEFCSPVSKTCVKNLCPKPWTNLPPFIWILLTCVQSLAGQKHQQEGRKASEHRPQIPFEDFLDARIALRGQDCQDCPQRLGIVPRNLSSSPPPSLSSSLFTLNVLSVPSLRFVLNSSLTGIISQRPREQQRTSNVISEFFSESKQSG